MNGSHTPPREDVTFISRNVQCSGWFYPADGTAGPAPCVVLAHGFDGVREQALDNYAARFSREGIAALVFDYRYFGASDGKPRQLFSNRAQLDDWRAAIEYAREHPAVDRNRIALWGTSTSGGHVVKLAAELGHIAAVVVQMPFTSGFAQLRLMPITQNVRLVWAGLRDQVAAWLHLDGVRIRAAGMPHTLAVVTSREALSGLDAITPKPSTWRNEVHARFTLTTIFYRPARAARRLRCPLLVCIADGDCVMPIKPALEMAKRATLRRYRFSHFAMYYGEGFARVVEDQAEFLRDHLVDPRRFELVT
jgi:dienelactone hydrolase